MNIYIFTGDPAALNREYGTASVYAHNVDEARAILAKHYPVAARGVKLARTIVLGRNPKAQLISSYFE